MPQGTNHREVSKVHHAITERLRAQNNGQPWLDCNDRDRPHHWVWETNGAAGKWFTCKRCPVSTVSNRLDSDGRRVPPSPFLR